MAAVATERSLTELFCELVRVPSPSGRELALATLVCDWLASAGVRAGFDGTGELNDSDAGNLVATVPGAPGAPVLLFVAHMDTVESGAECIEPVLDEDGVIRSAGNTILGSDNKSAVAAVMALCRDALQMPADRRPTVLGAFTTREETGRMGAGLLSLGDLQIDCAFCVDGSHPIGTVINRALGQTTFNLVVRGRRSHAAMSPEAGIHAIAVASEIVAALPLGRQAHGGSIGIASVLGGAIVDRLERLGCAAGEDVVAVFEATPTNSVPDVALVRGEVRGYSAHDVDATLAEVLEVADRVVRARGASLSWRPDPNEGIPPMPGAEGSRGLELVRAAAARVPGIELDIRAVAATLEANHLARLCDTVAVSSGGRDPHQVSESIAPAELQQLHALLLEICRAAFVGGS